MYLLFFFNFSRKRASKLHGISRGPLSTNTPNTLRTPPSHSHHLQVWLKQHGPFRLIKKKRKRDKRKKKEHPARQTSVWRKSQVWRLMDEKNSLTLPLHGREATSSSGSTIRQQYTWLATYFALNLALTLYNKAVMGKVGWLPSMRRGMQSANWGSLKGGI